MENGSIVERGTYAELIAADGTFSRLSRDYGGARDEVSADAVTREKSEKVVNQVEEGLPKQKSAALMSVEERASGGVSGSVYRDYLKASGAYITLPIIAVSLVLLQGSQVLSQFELTWFQENLFNRPGNGDSFYVSGFALQHHSLTSHASFTLQLGLYAALCIFSASFVFLTGAAIVTQGINASKASHSCPRYPGCGPRLTST